MNSSAEGTSDTDELIRETYRIVGEPERLAELQERIERGSQALGDDAAMLDLHFEQAGRLFDALPEHEARDFSRFGMDGGAHVPQAEPGELLRLDEDLMIVGVEVDFGASSALQVGLSFLDFLAKDGGQARNQLKELAQGTAAKRALVIRFYADPDDRRGRLGLATQADNSADTAIIIRRMGLTWSEKDTEAFSGAFGLTKTEVDLVRNLIEGRSVTEFAELRGRSIATARTQLKRLQQKLAVASQGEIISLYAGFVGLLANNAIDQAISNRSGQSVEIGGETIRYERFGTPGGAPLLLLHGALEGPFLTKAAIAEAIRRGFDVFAPWMPFYTGSGSGQTAQKRIDSFADLLPTFAAKVGLGQCPILACSMSTAYGFAAIARHPEAFAGLVLAGIALPLTEVQDRSAMNLAWRAPFELGSRFPRFFEVFARALFRLALRGEAHQFFDKLFKDSPKDLATLRDPEVAQTMRQGAEHRPDQFGAAMAHGFAIMTSDWSEWLGDLQKPVRLVFGEDDVVFPAHEVAAFAERWGITAIGPIEEVAGFSLFQAPELVFGQVEALSA